MAGACARQSIGDGKAWKRAVMSVEAGHDTTDEVGVDERPRCVVDEDTLGGPGAQRLKPVADRILAVLAAPHGRPQACGKVHRSSLIEPDVILMNDHDDIVDARVRGERADRAGQHRHAPNRQILFWDYSVGPRGSRPAAG